MIHLEVLGVPAPQGSKRGFVVGKKGGPQRAIVVEGGSKAGREKLGSWRQDVIEACQRFRTDALGSVPLPVVGPLAIDIRFRLPRPPSAPRSRYYPTVKPDIDKLVRGTLDAMKIGGLIVDDAQICNLFVRKDYPTPSEQIGASISVSGL